MKSLLFLCLVLFTVNFSHSQYSISVFSENYVGLTSADTLDKIMTSQISVTDIYGPVPIGFDFKIEGLAYNSVHFSENGFAVFQQSTDPQYYISIFDSPLQNFSGISSNSPILYKTEGVAGDQIFKCEYKNFGFENDTDDDDFVSFQLWLYEDCNQFELRIGDHLINSDVFFNSYPAPYMGIGSYDATNEQQVLSGPTANPVLVSTTTTMDTVPSTNSVYRFDDCSVGISELKQSLAVYPNPFTQTFFLQFDGNAEEVEVEITDLSGKSFYHETFITTTEPIEVKLEHVIAGTYFVKLKSRSTGKTVIQKLVKL